MKTLPAIGNVIRVSLASTQELIKPILILNQRVRLLRRVVMTLIVLQALDTTLVKISADEGVGTPHLVVVAGAQRKHHLVARVLL